MIGYTRLVQSGAVVLTGAALLSSCQIIGLRQQVEKVEEFGVVTVRVSPPPSGPAPTYGLAWTQENGEMRSAGFQRVRPDGLLAFTLRTDRSYTVGAFTDQNRNDRYDVGEPVDYVSGITPVSLADPNAVARRVRLTLVSRHNFPPGTSIAIPKENKELGGELNVALGEVVSLDDPRFATDAGGGGLWRPMDFLSQNRLGIYFTEPYDPGRIPVLLVYGIGGTPQDWRYFVQHFDRKKYQVWFFHYPSGMRLPRVARALATGLELLRERYGFKECDIVAHSMGGLVSRAAINEVERLAGFDFIPRFVSISTPWGGHAAAKAGIRRLKRPVPSWLDVAPDSDFLANLYSTPLPQGTRHLLIYGSKEGGPFWLKGENDGVVTVASETEARIKSKAAKVEYLPYGHVEILEQEKTLRTSLRFLAGE
jgi:pimeloyl-ACP methyl ester carboxylesterase